MLGGYMGKVLWVDLSSGSFSDGALDEKMCRQYIGGYGLAARLIYDRQKSGVDALGPENILGLMTGPLTGTQATTGARFSAVGKSPLTGGWGDASSGGHFGPFLKFASYDAVLFTGISPEPVYLLIDNGRPELKDAKHLWGKMTQEVEEHLESIYPAAKVAVIGPAGEKLSRVACIITNRGDAAGRSGMGAVMGSKKLKAVVVRGDRKVPVVDGEAVDGLRQEQVRSSRTFLERFTKYGTGSHADSSALSGDSPVKNWGGVGIKDIPDVSSLHGDKVIANLDHRKGCWHCPAACKASLKAGSGEYNYPAGNHRLEYETMAAFGSNCANTNLESLNMANYICNSYGMDTISAGSIIAFAMECYENGLISKTDTDGIELKWGDHRALIAMLEKMVKREGFGDILADGVKLATERIGRGCEQFSVHIGGQEVGMHDPKGGFMAYIGRPMGSMYVMDATPGRHTGGFGPTAFIGTWLNAAGLCLHGNLFGAPEKYYVGYARSVMGWDYTLEELLKTGDRIATMRHLFNLREGINPLKHAVHNRILGRPPFNEGPLAGVTVDLEAQNYWNLGYLDWDRITTKPSRKKLLALDMPAEAEALWPAPTGGQGSPVQPAK
ncbi:MAG TPA: aldehyde ferredoxin oxidoreductase family protein [Dehalococcoidales bacterium]|nr:aldehyde ferredoxin oxidoreductase family protein [Dehalococcoidales bacterium]